jgi:hypothetical protein
VSARRRAQPWFRDPRWNDYARSELRRVVLEKMDRAWGALARTANTVSDAIVDTYSPGWGPKISAGGRIPRKLKKRIKGLPCVPYYAGNITCSAPGYSLTATGLRYA